MLSAKVVALSLAVFTAVSFVLCVAWGLLVPESFHMHTFLEAVLPGFQWLSPGAFLLGLVESFAWGVYGGLVYVPIYNAFHRRWATP
ncbi:MAG: DUF5676 family membrane protein [Gemmatimonadota bacterium]